MRKLLRDLTPGQDYLLSFRTNNGENVSDWSQVYQFKTIGDNTPPANPGNLDWKPTGESFLATWDAPTLDGNGKVLKDFKNFEITVEAAGKTKVYTTTDTTWELTLVMNAAAFGGIELTVKITVKSVDNTGNKSSGVTKTATEDTPPIPSTPIVTNNMGLLAVEWNGKTSLGTINPFNLNYIEIHASKTLNFTPSDTTVVDRFEGWATGSQKKIITGLDYGTIYYFKLVSVNKKLKKSSPSPQAQGTATRISGLDIENGSISVDQINFANELGGARAWHRDDAPTTGVKEGDIWFDTNDQNHIYVRESGQWVDARDAAIAAAQSTANTAVTAANGKNKIYAQTAQPSGGTYVNGDTWFDTDDGNRPYTYINGTWTNMRDATIAAAQTAANSALTAANGKNRNYSQPSQPTGGTYINGDLWFDTDDQNKPYVYMNGTWSNVRDTLITDAINAAGAADTKAIAAQNAANAAGTTANNAQIAADAAATAAQTADANALAASGLAASKGKVWYQTSAPAGNANDLWIDTTNNANTPKRWNGTTWVAVTDKAATDAAAAAATANTAAGTAQQTANTAVTNAQTAQNRADSAHGIATTANTTANGKNSITYSTADASGSGTRAGDIWFKRDAGGVVIAQWEWTGSAWQTRTLGNAVIANLDAGKLTAGTISADRIGATSITADKLAANSVIAEKIAAGAVTATKILAGEINTGHMTANTINGDRIQANTLAATKIIADSITAAQIAADTITASELQANSVTAIKIAANSVTAEKILAGSVTADKILAGAVTAEKINAGAVTADKVGTNQIITVSANIGTAVIDAANIASVNAATITTGEMKSSQTVNYNGVTKPLWSIDLNGLATFSEAFVYGQLVVGSSNAANVQDNAKAQVRSYNYIANSAGWSINGDGSVEFGSAIIRGTYRSNITGRRVEILSGGSSGNITFFSPAGQKSDVKSSTIQGATTTIEALSSQLYVPNSHNYWNSINIQDNQFISMYTRTQVSLIGGNTTNDGGFIVYHTPNITNDQGPYRALMQVLPNVIDVFYAKTGGSFNVYQQAFAAATPSNVTEVFARLKVDNNQLFHDGNGPVAHRFDANNGNINYWFGSGTVTYQSAFSGAESPKYTLMTGDGYGAMLKFVFFGGLQRLELRGPTDQGWQNMMAGTIWADQYNLHSDMGLKENIEPVPAGALSEIKSTSVYTYEMKAPEQQPNVDGKVDKKLAKKKRRRTGIIAQEATSDILVGDEEQGYGVDLYAMVSKTWKGLQEEDDKVDQLEARIKQLEDIITKLNKGDKK